MDKLIVLTGASGVLGEYFLEKIIRIPNFEIIVLTEQAEKIEKKYRNFNNLTIKSRINFFEDDLVKKKIQEAGKQKEVCFFNMGFPRTSDLDKLIKAINDYEKALKFFTFYEIKCIINISSQSVYNQKNNCVETENSVVAPNSAYGFSKYVTERLTELYCKGVSTSFINIRLGSMVAPELSERILNRLIKESITEGTMTIKTGFEMLSYIYVEDVVEVLLEVINKINLLENDIYNLGSSIIFNTKELAKCVSKCTEKKININETKTNEVFSNCINSQKLYSIIEWNDETNIETIIKKLH